MRMSPGRRPNHDRPPTATSAPTITTTTLTATMRRPSWRVSMPEVMAGGAGWRTLRRYPGMGRHRRGRPRFPRRPPGPCACGSRAGWCNLGGTDGPRARLTAPAGTRASCAVGRRARRSTGGGRDRAASAAAGCGRRRGPRAPARDGARARRVRGAVPLGAGGAMSCSCCRAAPCEEMFGAEDARHDMEDYLAKGLGDIESRALAAMPASAADGARVLDVGGGVGAFAAELMKRGAASGEVVELVGAYAPYAARLAERLGLAGRTSFRVHDLLADPEGVDPADVVVLNRVVCCSAEGPALTAVAARLARR